MEVKFDFEVDNRFNYWFTKEDREIRIDGARDAIHIMLKDMWGEIDKYGGVLVVIVSDKITALKRLNIKPKNDLNKDLPIELMNRIKTRLSPRYLRAVIALLKDAI